MSNFIDVKYLNLLSSQLGQFKRKNDNLYNFRCPFCGDSQKDKTKARGYVFQKEADLIFKCHNCGIGAGMSHLIKHVNPEMHKQFMLEKFGTRVNKKVDKQESVGYKKVDIRRMRKPQFLKDTPLSQIKKVSQLKFDHPAKQYIVGRKIPTNRHAELFYAPKFYKWVNECIPNKFPNVEKDEPRLVIPFIDEHNRLIGFQGRAFGKSVPKYITIMLDEDAPKIYGLNRVDWSKPVIIVEGPIDSMFLDNAIAMAGSDSARFEVENAVFCWDNEPRSRENIRRMENAIEEGKSVVIFPNGIEEKDINDMILGGRDVMEIQTIISNNTFKGLSAKAKLSEWRKI
jgi:transcription elongation factor Elf1